MMLEFLPEKFKLKLKEFNDKNLNEVRIRANNNVKILYKGKLVKLNLIATLSDVEQILLNACKNSVYSYDNQIKQGFITTDNGERIGLCGEFVFNGDDIIGIKNFTSLCVRVPCEVKEVSLNFFNKVYKGGSVLVMSKTGVGKTTFIRDLCRNLSNLQNNVVLIDERNEIACKNQDFSFDVGENTDILTYSNKYYGFNQGVRALNPSYIVTDELITKNDFISVYTAINCGVNVVATLHCDSIDRLKNKENIQPLIVEKSFNYYVLLKNVNGNRQIDVFDKNLDYLCCI